MLEKWTKLPGWQKFLILYLICFLIFWSDVQYSSTYNQWYGGMSPGSAAIVALFVAGFMLFLSDPNR